MRLLSERDIAVKSYEDAMEIVKVLLRNSYCVMLSMEEDLVIIHYEWTQGFADRNQMVFRNREDLELEYEDYLKDMGDD